MLCAFFTLAALCISEKLSAMIAGAFKPVGFDLHFRHGIPVAFQLFAARRLIQLTVFGTKQMAVRNQLFSAPTMNHHVASEFCAPRPFKKETRL
jgi:hypothetical protein